MEEKTYLSTVDIVGEMAINVATSLPNVCIKMSVPQEVMTFAKSTDVTMALVEEKPEGSNWFSISILLLYDKSNTDKYYIPECYQTRKDEIMKKFQTAFIK